MTKTRACFYLAATRPNPIACCRTSEYDASDQGPPHAPRQEQDRVDNMSALDAQPGLVFLAYRDQSEAVGTPSSCPLRSRRPGP